MDYSNLLKQHGLKVTKPRKAILDLLHSNEHGLDADTIKKMIEDTDLYIDLSTVYRTLDTFVNNKIVSKYDLGDKKYNYKINTNNHIHHLECEICKKNFDLDCPMTLIEELISKETGFLLTEHKIELKGVCKDCQAKLNDSERKELQKNNHNHDHEHNH